MSLESMLAELELQLGSEIYLGAWLTIDQARIDRFAEATNDHQWLHTDVERARSESPYRTTIAHGYLTLALIPYLTRAVDPERPRFPGVRMVINYGANRVRFPAPVPVGARIRARTVLQAVEKAKGGLLVTEQVTVEIEGQARPGCVAERLSLYLF